jgi:hypothetical protein
MIEPPGHATTVTVTDHRGVPLRAECSCGLWFWTRPDGDTWATTLDADELAHRREVVP